MSESLAGGSERDECVPSDRDGSGPPMRSGVSAIAQLT
jgi:hypothetical protein